MTEATPEQILIFIAVTVLGRLAQIVVVVVCFIAGGWAGLIGGLFLALILQLGLQSPP